MSGLVLGPARSPSPSASPAAASPTRSAPGGDAGGVLGRMEAAFGVSFARVRLVHGSPLARRLGVRAVTRGEEVHFSPGWFQPHQTAGQALIGHELTHVIQQRAGRARSTRLLGGVACDTDPALEREADAAGRRAARGDAAPVRGAERALGPASGEVAQGYNLVQTDGGRLAPDAFRIRAEAQSRGVNGFGNDNLAIVAVNLADGRMRYFRAYSVHGVAHAEERALADVFAAYPTILRDRPPPDHAGVDRIAWLYTERAPCTAGNAEQARRGRNDGSCNAYLDRVLNAGVNVYYSVAHDGHAHGALMGAARTQYVQEIADSNRRLTYAEARGAANLGAYQAPIRARFAQDHPHLANGPDRYGRDYVTELARVNWWRVQLAPLVKAVSALGSPAPNVEAALAAAFEATDHGAGSAAALVAIDAAGEQLRAQLERELEALTADEDMGPKKDGGGPPEPPKPGAGASGGPAPLGLVAAPVVMVE